MDGFAGDGQKSASTKEFFRWVRGPWYCLACTCACNTRTYRRVFTRNMCTFFMGSVSQMGGREGIRRRESTHLTLQTAGTRGIRMHLVPRDQEQGADA